MALNSGLSTLLGFIYSKNNDSDNSIIFLLASISGIIMCYLWYRIVRSYKGLNTGKFKVVHAIEARLPLALYDAEWEALGRGKNKKLYWPFTHIELFVPWIFIIMYLIILLFLVWRDFVIL